MNGFNSALSAQLSLPHGSRTKFRTTCCTPSPSLIKLGSAFCIKQNNPYSLDSERGCTLPSLLIQNHSAPCHPTSSPNLRSRSLHLYNFKPKRQLQKLLLLSFVFLCYSLSFYFLDLSPFFSVCLFASSQKALNFLRESKTHFLLSLKTFF